MLGLWGMGGIGKTTAAAKLFNSLLPDFGDAACFLGNVRDEASHAGGLIKLQQKLLTCLARTHVVVEDVDSGAPECVLESTHATSLGLTLAASPCFEMGCMRRLMGKHHRLLCGSNACMVDAGRGMLTTHLKLRKVLVVIDDTDDAAQLKSLLPPCELHPESLVIVTSRKKDILETRCTTVSEVQLLREGRDTQLFQAWAFAAGSPARDTLVLVPEVVACCGGLPLTLKVGAAHGLQCDPSLPWCPLNYIMAGRVRGFSEQVLCMRAGPGRPPKLSKRTGH